MAWGAILLRLPNVKSVFDLPEDFKVLPIGSPEEIYAAMLRVLPDQKHILGESEYRDATGFVEFSYPSDKQAESIGIRSNAGPGALAAMKLVCDALDLKMVDSQAGEIADFATETQKLFDEYRRWSSRALDPKNW